MTLPQVAWPVASVTPVHCGPRAASGVMGWPAIGAPVSVRVSTAEGWTRVMIPPRPG